VRRSSGARLAAAAFLLALSGQVALSGCGGGGDDGPSWSDLSLVEAAGTLPSGTLAGGVRVENKDGELWLVAPIAREAWRAGDGAGRYFTGLPVLAVGHPRDGGPAYRCVADGKELAYEAELERFGKTPERFTTNAAHALRLELCLATDVAPPETSEFWACLAYAERPDGHARVRGRRLSGAGFWVPSEHPRTLNLRLAPDAKLSFATGVEPLFGARAERTAPQVFRVFLDGALLLEYRAEVDMLGESLVWHSLELPHGGVQRAELRFEVAGPLALTSILAPEIGPRAGGAPSRPRGPTSSCSLPTPSGPTTSRPTAARSGSRPSSIASPPPRASSRRPGRRAPTRCPRTRRCSRASTRTRTGRSTSTTHCPKRWRRSRSA
jgi:hypothetical protein